MKNKQNHEIRANMGLFSRTVACRLAEDVLEIERDSDVTRFGYDAIAEIRFYRRGSGRCVLVIATKADKVTTLRISPDSTSGDVIDDFVKSLLSYVALVSPAAQVVIGPSRTQWTASWIGLVASGAVLLLAAWGLLAGDKIGALLFPVGIALINLVIVVPILRSGRPRQHSVTNARSSGLLRDSVLPGQGFR